MHMQTRRLVQFLWIIFLRQCIPKMKCNEGIIALNVRPFTNFRGLRKIPQQECNTDPSSTIKARVMHGNLQMKKKPPYCQNLHVKREIPRPGLFGYSCTHVSNT